MIKSTNLKNSLLAIGAMVLMSSVSFAQNKATLDALKKGVVKLNQSSLDTRLNEKRTTSSVKNVNKPFTKSPIVYSNVVGKTTALVTDTIEIPSLATCSPVLVGNTAGGYLMGTNSYGDLEKTQKFLFTGTGDISEVLVAIAGATDNVGGSFTAKIYDVDGTGEPGTMLAESDPVLIADVDTSFLTSFMFATPVTITGDFFVSIVVENGGDEIGILHTIDGCVTAGYTAYEMWSDNSWNTIQSGWTYTTNLFVYPIITYQVADEDAGVLAITSPNTGSCALSATSQIVVNVKNIGTTALTALNVSYQINNGTVVTENVGAIAANTTISYTFTATADLSAVGTYSIKAFTGLATDANNANDTITKSVVSNAPQSLPYFDGFEAANINNWTIINANNDGAATWSQGSTSGIAKTGTKYIKYSYSTPNAADDWAITPCIAMDTNNVYTLNFYYRSRTASYPEKLKVFIGTSNDVASMTTQLVDLPNIASTTYSLSSTNITVPSDGVYYIGLYAYSDADQFELIVDDFEIIATPSSSTTPDLNVTKALASEYTAIPMDQTSEMNISATIVNSGTAAATNVKYNYTIKNIAGTVLNSGTSAVEATLAAGATVTIDVATGFTPSLSAEDILTVEFAAVMDSTDSTPNNNLMSRDLYISDSTYARDQAILSGVANSLFGYTNDLTGQNLLFGQLYEITTPTYLTSISAFVAAAGGTGAAANPIGTDTTRFVIYDYDDITGEPNVEFARSEKYTFGTALTGSREIKRNIEGGPLLLDPGKYFIGIREIAGARALYVFTKDSIYTEGTAFFRWSDGTWYDISASGVLGSYLIRPQFGEECGRMSLNTTGIVGDTNNTNTGTATVVPAGGNTSGYTYSWTNSSSAVVGTSATISGMPAGSYDVTVTDGIGCTEFTSVNIPSIVTGVKNVAKNTAIRVYPNPASDVININMANEKATNVSVLNALGQVVYSAKNVATINTSNLAEGTYTVKIQTEKSVITEKINIVR